MKKSVFTIIVLLTLLACKNNTKVTSDSTEQSEIRGKKNSQAMLFDLWMNGKSL